MSSSALVRIPNMSTVPSKVSREKEGIALIMVIGLLALMMVLGVAFSVYMRTGRLAAGSFKNGIITRQLQAVALNRAMAAINDDLVNRAYPRWDYLASVGTADDIDAITNANLLAWIPRGALGSGSSPTAKWIDINDGRVGYLIVNCSGLLDVNHSGNGFTVRGLGTNVNEIQKSSEVVDIAVLVSGRPYETIQELGVKGHASGALGSQTVSNLVCYSAFPYGYPGGTNLLPMADLSGDETALNGRHMEIVNGLIASGIAADQAEFVFMNLLDYVDPNNIPRNLASACTENVPMFNEICVTNLYRFFANTNFDMRARISLEWFYPFVKSSDSSFVIEYRVSFERALATPANFPLPAGATNFIPSGYARGASCEAPSVNFSIPITNYLAFVGAKVSLKAKINLRMHADDASGPVVDASPADENLTIDLTMPVVTVPSPSGAANISVVNDAECIDPRFNWEAPPSLQWSVRPTINSLTKTNAVTIRWLSLLDTDGYAGMYVANRPLTSVSELTYLLRGQTIASPDCRWNTIRLFDWTSPSASHSRDTVLDHFVIGTNTLMKGFVNPNSGNIDALTAVFEGMPINRYPDEAGFVMTHPQAVALAEFWADTNQNPQRCSFANLSDIGHATNVFGSIVLNGLTPFQKESFFRNTAGLFNTRQQYFMILLFAQATKEIPFVGSRIVLDDLYGVAEVWRDPLPNASGIHPCIVRMVQQINKD